MQWGDMHVLAAAAAVVVALVWVVRRKLARPDYARRPLERVPAHLAVVLQNGNEARADGIERVLHWAAEKDVPLVTLYHMAPGVLEALELRPPTRTQGGSSFETLFISSKDGRAAFNAAVQAAPQPADITEAYLDEQLVAFRGRPDPELMIVFGAARCVYGFPAWPISVTEMCFNTSLAQYSYNDFLHDLHHYADTKVIKGV
eukprot:TRINITY_DN15213_c0_g1_i1.p1 TRINITY_DN15213_c0_g1~~TRINITY_DN15213_c0_g1_i1.p1  ORF type:complete len:202 (+),score=81.06 TRINITY_DN15213_c0_g1_i1:45-650(+)